MTGALAGLLAAAGLLLVWARLPHRRRPRLEDRIAPYLAEPVLPSALLRAPGPAGQRAVTVVLAPVLADLAARLDGLIGGSASVRRRVERSGSDGVGGLTVERFRQEQVIAATLGGLLGLTLLALRLATGWGLPPLTLAGASVLFLIAGFLGRDQLLTRAVARREAALAEELPVVAELLALAVAAGEAPAGALARVASVTSGELAAELQRALAEARAGATLTLALSGIARRTGVPALGRFVDGMTVAISRGTPLADVLRAQAADAREAGKRALLEAGGRKEVAMLVPVVFLVLPITILFALYPGAVTLTTLTH